MESNTIKCPKCGCTQIHSDKKGFSTGKAVAGALVGGVLVGAAAGGIGKDKIILTCLKCGHQFKIGDKPQEEASPKVQIITSLLMVALFIWILSKCS